MEPDKVLDKAPGSGGPIAGNPRGVKSGAMLLAQTIAGVEKGEPPVDAAPAEALVRETNEDGTASDTVVARDPKETRTPDADTSRMLTAWTDTPGGGDAEAPGTIDQANPTGALVDEPVEEPAPKAAPKSKK